MRTLLGLLLNIFCVTLMASSLLIPGEFAQERCLASLYLRRDQSLPVILSTTAASVEDEGYAEGVVTNTRFGSFPHSTIIGAPWGSQIRASKVDTGSRGRNATLQGKKRKASDISGEDEIRPYRNFVEVKEATLASSGFIHVLQPTPENWTTSLPHRTQVVYTPDYSYILHRIRVRPGSVLIEAGSGSGSFTHAAARAVFDGFTDEASTRNGDETPKRTQSRGKVYTYEFHEERHHKVKQEMQDHGLASVVHAMHRDVYKGGFLLENEGEHIKSSPEATAVFLDLPAPWEALGNLTRDSADGKPSALNPTAPVHICTFSPCIEQAQKTVSYLRRYGWLEIETVEVQHKRIDVRREYTGLAYDGMRGVNAIAVDVDEAVTKLREVEQRAREFHLGQGGDSVTVKSTKASNKQQDPARTLFKEGKLVHRSEPELKTHTSYLVFAILPRSWSEKDESEARERWSKPVKINANVPKSQRQLKKEAKHRAKNQGHATTRFMGGGSQKQDTAPHSGLQNGTGCI